MVRVGDAQRRETVESLGQERHLRDAESREARILPALSMNQNYENNLLSILSFAATRSTWVSLSSCASMTHVEWDTAYRYFERNDFLQVAEFYRFDYSIRKREKRFYLSVIWRGYA